ncbi:MAG: hypothetical protein IPM57_07825 [Oligoflexia bacterium]|nr:hypothetical protein [Oligoflexia bacterium]
MKPKTWACTKCKKRKDFNKTYYGAAAQNKYGLSLKCKACVNKARRRKK